MKDDGYVVIQAFMVRDLHLKGNELIVYATIYGFSQDGDHWFYGTKGYLAEWCGASKGTVGNCLRSLTERGLLERRETRENGQTKIEYRATKNATPPYKNCNTPRTKIDPINNIDRQPKREPSYMEKPTLADVESYVRERGYHFDPRHFFEYYEAGDWRMQNGKPVKRWRQCCATWERNWQRDNQGGESGGRIPEFLREYDI